MPARPKQQHFVTRAYLERFLDPDCERLFCYGRQRNAPFQSKPEQLARQRNYYSVPQADGSFDDSLEHRLEQVEVPGLEVIRKLAMGRTRLSLPERRSLALLMGVQRSRVPQVRNLVDSTYSEVTSTLLKWHDKQASEGPGQMSLRRVPAYGSTAPIEGSEITVNRDEMKAALSSLDQDPEEFSRNGILRLAIRFAEIFLVMKWTVFYADSQTPFICSDCPVLFRYEGTDIAMGGIARPDTIIEFPLSRTSLLSLTHDIPLITRLNALGPRSSEAQAILKRTPEIRIVRADQAQVREFNLNQALYCSRWTYAGRENEWLLSALRAPSKSIRHRLTWDGKLIRVEATPG